MRFSCASTESVIPTQPKRAPRKAPAPKKRAGSRKKAEEKPRMKTRSASRAARLESVARALKKKEKQVEVITKAPDPFIYVGNLQGGVTEERLRNIFSRCGRVTRIQIRCSGGQAVTVGVGIPDALKGPRDRQYATVEFTQYTAVREALKLHGRNLNGVPLVVTVSAVDLPEMKDIIDNRMNQMRSRKRQPTDIKQSRANVRPLRSAPTEPFIADSMMENRTPRATDRFKVMGYSFAATVV